MKDNKYLFSQNLTDAVVHQAMQDGEQFCGEIILFCDRTEAAKHSGSAVDYVEFFGIDAETVYGIGYEGQLISSVGALNPVLTDDSLSMYEYAGRLVSVSGKCRILPLLPAQVVSAQDDMSGDFRERYVEELALVYAYILRWHTKILYEQNLMDAASEKMCLLMQEKGCFGEFQKYMRVLFSDAESFERIAGYTAPFVVLRGDETCVGVLRQFADDLTEALVENGQAVLEISRVEDCDYDRLHGVVVKGIVGFQTRALEIDYFRRLHGPKFQFWFDYPLHFQGLMRNLPDNEYVLCQDANYAELIRRYFHTPNAIHFFPGGHEESAWTGDRPYDISFIGSYFPDEGDDLDEENRRFYCYMLEHPALTFEQGARALNGWAENVTSEMVVSQNADEDEQFAQYMLKMQQACRAVIGHFRNRVIKTILDAGFELHVYGEFWKYSPFTSYGNMIMHSDIAPAESVKELQKAKIGLNIMSWHKAGMTERIANIMLAGALCLSEESVYLREHLEDEVVMFRLDELEKLPEQIRWLLDSADERQKIAHKGYEKAMLEYTWDSRARELIRLAESCI